MTLREAHDLALSIMIDAEAARDRYWSSEMADNDRIERTAKALREQAEQIEQGLARDGYQDYPNKPQDRDWRKGYAQCARDAERQLKE